MERVPAYQADALASKADGDSEGATPVIEIRLNGQQRHVPTGTTVAGLLRLLDIRGDRVAVELDRCIVRRPDWENSAIGPGAAVEIVHFVGGG